MFVPETLFLHDKHIDQMVRTVHGSHGIGFFPRLAQMEQEDLESVDGDSKQAKKDSKPEGSRDR